MRLPYKNAAGKYAVGLSICVNNKNRNENGF